MRMPHFATEVGTKTDIFIEEDTEVRITDDGDHDRFAHYVPKSEIVRSNVEGVPVVALCGKRWIPNRDPERYPVCPSCKEIRARLFGNG